MSKLSKKQKSFLAIWNCVFKKYCNNNLKEINCMFLWVKLATVKLLDS